MPLLRSLYFRDLPICLAWEDDLLDRHGSEWICIQSALKRDEVRKWNVWTDWPSTSSGAALARASILNCTVLCTATYALPLTRNQRNGIHVRCAEALASPPQLEKDSRKGRYPRSRSWALSLSVPEAETSGSVSNSRPPFRQVAPPGNLTTGCRGVGLSPSFVPNRSRKRLSQQAGERQRVRHVAMTQRGAPIFSLTHCVIWLLPRL